MKRNVTLWIIVISLMTIGLSFGQVFTEDFEDADVSDWQQYRLNEEMIQAVDMSTAPLELLEGGSKIGYIQDIDVSYNGVAILLTGEVMDANYTVEADVYVYENATMSAYTGLVAYADSARQGPFSHGYYVKLVADFDGSNRFRLYNNQLDMSTFGYTFHHSINADIVDKTEGWHHMQIDVATNSADSSVSYHCVYDEVDLGTFVDDTDRHTYAGHPGVFSFQQNGVDGLAGYFDNFVVTPAGGAALDETANRPVSMTLDQNYPNPFNPTTTISFDISEGGQATLQVINLKGELVQTLANGYIQSGNYQLIWDGTDSQGQSVVAGAYVVVLSRGSEQLSRSMLMIK
ncbi:MAG: FlgD immunoglobulin-like domain containing protein [Candidatus Marinimicrobia bacterium]|nr:FlgD immunoglobulin-like domain containing protein [Candidatus Neomarinimicrobiota bacterium]